MLSIAAVSDKGGSVTFNKRHNVWASYAVAKVGDLPEPEILTASVGLADGRTIALFANRESGLVVVDVIDKGGKSGVELFRRTV